MPQDMIDRTVPRVDYQQVVQNDVRKPAADMLHSERPDMGVGGIPRERYIDPACHRREVELLWSRTWQMACREEQIPEVGDMLPYDIADRSAIIVRSAPGEIKAFANACTHRGTRLCSTLTSVEKIRCPYHGFTWNLDGALVDLPAAWDFPHVSCESHSLDDIQVERWGGFVFVNFDPDAPPLADYLDALPAHMADSQFDRQYVAGQYVKILPCNWKAAIEAFIEAYHVLETHNQTALITDEWATQYDCEAQQPHWSRFMEPLAIPPRQNPQMTEQQLLVEMFAVTHAGEAPRLRDGETARQFVARARREQLAAQTGRDFSALSDAEAVDSLQYLVFPNVVIFRGYGVPAVYRFRPNGNDPDSSIFDLYVMQPTPVSGDAPESPDPVMLGDRSFAEANPLPPWLGHVFDQDIENLGLQQIGLKSSQRREITLSQYQEIRIRHFHQTLEHYLK